MTKQTIVFNLLHSKMVKFFFFGMNCANAMVYPPHASICAELHQIRVRLSACSTCEACCNETEVVRLFNMHDMHCEYVSFLLVFTPAHCLCFSTCERVLVCVSKMCRLSISLFRLPMHVCFSSVYSCRCLFYCAFNIACIWCDALSYIF